MGATFDVTDIFHLAPEEAVRERRKPCILTLPEQSDGMNQRADVAIFARCLRKCHLGSETRESPNPALFISGWLDTYLFCGFFKILPFLLGGSIYMASPYLMSSRLSEIGKVRRK